MLYRARQLLDYRLDFCESLKVHISNPFNIDYFMNSVEQYSFHKVVFCHLPLIFHAKWILNT